MYPVIAPVLTMPTYISTILFNSNSNFSLLTYKKIIEFCILTHYPVT